MGGTEMTMAESFSPLQQPVSSDQQQIASASILLQIVMLGLAFVLGHVLRRHKVYYLNEASASLLLGLFVGLVANVSNTEARFRQWFNFHEEFFLLFLLPPIIFESGFSLQPKPFFSNFGAIIVFAILGTFITSIVTGILVYLGGQLYLMYSLPFRESLMYGALISATDPVSVLAIFQELGTDVNLYALVFGESVLNDAVAISLYRTLLAVKNRPLETHGFLPGIWSFLEIFVGSLSSGVCVALICALLFKYSGLAVHGLQNLECCLVVLFPYFSYMLAEGLGLSGIVAILFCGIIMKHYTFPNLSEGAQAFTSGFFQLISSLAETFVFIYMGMDIAIKSHSWSHVGFIFFSIVFIVIARAANVFPCARLVNMLRPASRQIPINHQKALWFSGLRGAMAFALALQSVHDLPDNHGEIIFTATTAIVVLTVLLIGGSTSTMLEKLEVVGETPGNDLILDGEEEEMEGLTASSDNGHEDNDSENGHMDPLTQKFQELRKSTASFTAIDKNFLRPFFTKEDKRRNSTDQAPNGKEAADFEKVSSQTQGKRGGTRQSTGSPALNSDVEYGVPDMPRPWRQNSANIVQNRSNSLSFREDENPVRHSSVPTHLQPKDIRQQSNAARKEGKNRRPSF